MNAKNWVAFISSTDRAIPEAIAVDTSTVNGHRQKPIWTEITPLKQLIWALNG